MDSESHRFDSVSVNEKITIFIPEQGKIMKTSLLLYLSLAMATFAFAQDVAPERDQYDAPKKEYSPYVEDHFPNNVYFGDTHLHTSWSADIGMAGATLGPDEAYRVSRGETVTCHSSKIHPAAKLSKFDVNF